MRTRLGVVRYVAIVAAIVLAACESSTAPSDDPGPSGTILFSSDRTGDFEIFSMRPNGTGLAQVTNASGLDIWGDTSPDGSKIVIESSRTGSSKLYVMNGGGTAAVNISGTATDQYPSWSPDGRIAFTSTSRPAPSGGANGQVWVVISDGTDPTVPFGSGLLSFAAPDWGSNGTTVVVGVRSITQGADWNIWSTTVPWTPSTLNMFTVLTSGPSTDSFPRISPNGARIVFHSDRSPSLSSSAADAPGGSLGRQASGGPKFDIYLMNADGSGQTNLTNHIGDDLYPDWSPDGEWVVFASNRTGNYEIFVMRADGTRTGSGLNV